MGFDQSLIGFFFGTRGLFGRMANVFNVVGILVEVSLIFEDLGWRKWGKDNLMVFVQEFVFVGKTIMNSTSVELPRAAKEEVTHFHWCNVA